MCWEDVGEASTVIGKVTRGDYIQGRCVSKEILLKYRFPSSRSGVGP